MKRSFTHPDPLLFDHMHKVINIYLPSLWLVKGDPSLLFYLYIFCICISPRWQGGSLTLKGLFYRGWWWRWWWHSRWRRRLCRFLSIISSRGTLFSLADCSQGTSIWILHLLKSLDCKKTYLWFYFATSGRWRPVQWRWSWWWWRRCAWRRRGWCEIRKIMS